MDFEDDEIFYNCGQKFYILDKDIWEIILKRGEFRGTKVDGNALITKMISNQIAFAEKNRDFRCAITEQQIGKMKDRVLLVSYLFYKVKLDWQRVQLETTECIDCGWRGTIANPTVHDLYLPLSNGIDLERKSCELQKVGCPKCNGRLKRFAIWAEAL